MIEVRDLYKSYAGRMAVAGISFDIARGETFGLLGPNGAGKTTTILLLVGALAADSGSVCIDGSDDPTRAEVRRRIGVAPQALALYLELSGEENLRFFGRLYGLTGSLLVERVDRALALAGLEARRRDRVRTYSGGMQRRLNLAAAILHDPPVLLFDEPTVGVDPQSRNHIFAAIEGLRRAGRTILYTTHYMEEAERLCDRVAVLDQGKILDLDTVAGLIRRHGGKAVIEATLAREPSSPAGLPGTLAGTRLTIDSERPFEDALRLTDHGVELIDLQVRRPNLESVFLTLTGRRLRDE